MKNTFGGFLRNSPPIIMGGVLMFRSERMRRTGARSTASGTSSHMQSWAGCITGTHESSFWKRQPHEPPINVCFQGKSGHDADMAKSTRLTQIIADPMMFDCYANRRRS